MRSVQRSGEQGFALVAILLLLMLGLTLGASALLYSAIEIKATQNYKSGQMAFASAESAATHALNQINKRMVQHFKNDIVDEWTTHTYLSEIGTQTLTMWGNDGMSYGARVRGMNSAERDGGFIFARGWGPNDAVRTVTLRVMRSPLPQGIGAIFGMNENLPTGALDNNGNAVSIDGNDTDVSNVEPTGADTMCGAATGGSAVPAVNTQNESSMDNLIGSLDAGEYDQYRGMGEENCVPQGNNFTCERPAILPLGGPRPEDLDDIIDNLQPSGMDDCELSDLSGSCQGAGTFPLCNNVGEVTTPNDCILNPGSTGLSTLGLIGSGGNSPNVNIGSYDSPAIVHYDAGDTPTTINGNWFGYGVLILEGDITFSGNMNFGGLIIVKGNLTIQGNASIAGSVWFTGDFLTLGGSAEVCYSQEALQRADNAGIPVDGGPPRNLPTVMTVVSWMEGMPEDDSDVTNGNPTDL